MYTPHPLGGIRGYVHRAFSKQANAPFHVFTLAQAAQFKIYIFSPWECHWEWQPQDRVQEKVKVNEGTQILTISLQHYRKH